MVKVKIRIKNVNIRLQTLIKHNFWCQDTLFCQNSHNKVSSTAK